MPIEDKEFDRELVRIEREFPFPADRTRAAEWAREFTKRAMEASKRLDGQPRLIDGDGI